MPQPRAMERVDRDAASCAEPREALFKADHPRAIDRYIDYFGGAMTGADDPCGEAFLDALAPSER